MADHGQYNSASNSNSNANSYGAYVVPVVGGSTYAPYASAEDFTPREDFTPTYVHVQQQPV